MDQLLFSNFGDILPQHPKPLFSDVIVPAGGVMSSPLHTTTSPTLLPTSSFSVFVAVRTQIHAFYSSQRRKHEVCLGRLRSRRESTCSLFLNLFGFSVWVRSRCFVRELLSQIGS
ncbi:hypothetical protein P8452_38691 [Trifolium repens]|nr:hypothetical protein P8452_38691 [Trifolium repens]